jgi:dTMP kinase
MKKLKLRNNPYRGRLLVFEGTDGAGKTTLIELTRKYLEEKNGIGTVLCVKQPTDLSRKTKLFQKMMYSAAHEDIDYRAVQLLTMSDRIQHGHEVIEPSLKAGKTVICDRYIYTSLANMLARGYRKEKWFYEVAKNLLAPDVIFLAYVPAERAIERIKSRPSECDRFLDEELLKKVSGEFLRLSKSENFERIETGQVEEKSFEKVKETLIGRGI